MALKLLQNYKGIDAEYWRILTAISDMNAGKTNVILGLYVDKEAREAGEPFLLRENISVDGVDLTREAIYPLLKVSKIEQIENPETGEMEEVETNKFVDAEDC